MSDLQQRLAALSPEQRALLEMRLKQEGLDTLVNDSQATATAVATPSNKPNTAHAKKIDTSKGMQFSLYFFSGDGSTGAEDKYGLLIDSAKFADQHGYTAVWTPERHFQDFGGLYPNPAVVSAALAALTERVQLRAGSVAVPLHSPIRVCEEWAVVDNLSRGRVAICCASGWHPVDFILAPQPTLSYYEQRKQVMAQSIKDIRRMWAGETMTFTGIDGNDVNVRVLPRPVQSEVPIWIASQGSPETFIQAGELGANILTGIVNQPLEELEEKIRLYRDTLAKHGHDPQKGQVTVMLHTFLGEDNESVKAQVRKPLTSYLRTFIKQQENMNSDLDQATEADKEAVVEYAFERYFEESTLLGTPDKCGQLIDELIGIGVDEVACLIDFGVEHEAVLAGLHHLNVLKERYPYRKEAGNEGLS
ncbi:MAG: LLM class flavin-dependent oxidoreductase [Tumebacillaceae bacterium]